MSNTAQISKPRSFFCVLLLGMTTQLSNPKTGIVYNSIFAGFPLGLIADN